MTDLINNKKEAILNAASEIFYEKGYHRTKIDEIAKKAGIGKGTVYEYFSSKKELFEKVCINIIHKTFKDIEKVSNKQTDFKNKIIEILKYKYNTMNLQKNLAESFFANGTFISINLKQIFLSSMGSIYLYLIDIIESGKKEGVIKKDADVEIMVSYLIGVSNQYLGMKLFHYNAKEEDIDFEKILNSLLEGFGT